jgi:ABC-type transport system involved in multi-copper enzyme maturation permease subunit
MPRLRVILRLVIREAHDQTRSHRFLGLTAIAGLLAPLIVYVGVRDLTTRREQVDLLVQQRAVLEGPAGSARLNGRQLEPSLRVIRPSAVTSVLVRGFDGVLPTFWDFAPDGVHLGAGPGGASRTPQSGVSLDLEFLIRIVLGLLAVSLAAGALASERESGMLYVLMSQPVRPFELVAAKLIGGVAALGLALTVVVTGVAAAMGVFGPDLWSRDFEWTLIGVSGAALLYLSALYALGLLVGALVSSSSAANVAAISVWIIVAIASVPTIDVLARVIASVPAPEFVESRRQREFETQLRQSELMLGRWYLDYAGPDWRQANVADAARDQIWQAWTAQARARRQQLTRLDDDAALSTTRQRRLWTRLSTFTPAGVFFDAASRLAGTGLPTAGRWDQATKAYQEFLDGALFDSPPNVNLRIPSPIGPAMEQVKFRPLVESATLKKPLEPNTGLRASIGEARAPLGVLACYVLALVSLAFAIFPRIRY